MVAASSYQKDGRAAPARLTVAANTATISGSSQARGGVPIRRVEYPLNTSPWCQKSSGPHIKGFDIALDADIWVCTQLPPGCCRDNRLVHRAVRNRTRSEQSQNGPLERAP